MQAHPYHHRDFPPAMRPLSSPIQPRTIYSPSYSPPALREILPPASSTVVSLSNLRSTPRDLLWNLFSHGCSQLHLSPPAPVFARLDSRKSADSTIWAVFPSPQDARAALSLSCDIFLVHPATEADVPFLPPARRVSSDPVERDAAYCGINRALSPVPRQGTMAQLPPPQPRPTNHDLRDDFAITAAPSYTISSNPPNPKTSFRVGDWMCSALNCSAHNFQRNTVCIACGRPRTGGPPPSFADPAQSPTFPLANPSPRFAARFNGTSGAGSGISTSPPSSASSSPGYPIHSTASALASAQAQITKPPPPQYPPLTPSGRALTVGGRVRNISRDPLTPCVMYWPDNEPLPESCQIRPLDSALLTYPPIINTGNKGAAEKQPGDWLCGKCNYHNWRRRKVCQTCYPYAEGNGDSISAAVQAERIALLANVLATQFDGLDMNGTPNSTSLTSQPRPHSQNKYAPNTPDTPLRLTSRENSCNASPHPPALVLSENDNITTLPPIYQTSGSHPYERATPRTLLPFMNGGSNASSLSSSPRESHNLLPSFLQDIVHSSGLQSQSQSSSPTSSSSADLSYDGSSAEDAHYVLTPGTSTHSILPLVPNRNGRYSGPGPTACKDSGTRSTFSSLGRSSGSSIWRLDGEESKTLSSSSARTSPTTLHAQAAATAAQMRRHDPAVTVATCFPDSDSGTTPKGTGSFWQARYA